MCPRRPNRSLEYQIETGQSAAYWAVLFDTQGVIARSPKCGGQAQRLSLRLGPHPTTSLNGSLCLCITAKSASDRRLRVKSARPSRAAAATHVRFVPIAAEPVRHGERATEPSAHSHRRPVTLTPGGGGGSPG